MAAVPLRSFLISSVFMAHVACSSTLFVQGVSVNYMQLCLSRVQLGQHSTELLSRRVGNVCCNCRSPQTIMAASACAFMLRLSLVNMQGASGLAKDTYKFVAVSLTLATVCTSFAQLLQVGQPSWPSFPVHF